MIPSAFRAAGGLKAGQAVSAVVALVALLRRKEAEGVIRIETLQKNFLGVVVENATSLVVWGPA